MVGDAQAHSATLDAIGARRVELGDAAPRFGLFLCDCVDTDAIQKTLSRIPVELSDWFEEVVIMLDSPSSGSLSSATALQNESRFKLRFHRPPRDSGFGAVRKAAFEYALRKGFDQIVVMRGDATHPPEGLPELIQHALADPTRFVLATPRGRRSSPSFSHRFSTFIQNRILGLRLHDYRTSFRLYPGEALARIPFQLDSDGPLFDTEILLQLRALGIRYTKRLFTMAMVAATVVEMVVEMAIARSATTKTWPPPSLRRISAPVPPPSGTASTRSI